MLTHTELKTKAMEIPGVKEAYESLADEYTLARELIHARELSGLTQAEVALKMQTKAPAIARLEGGGKHSPSIQTLRKYAAAVGCDLEVRLVPKA